MFFLAIVPRSTVILFIWACSSSSFLFHYLTCEILFSFSNNDNFSNNKNSNNVAVLLRYISFISSDLFSFAAISCQPLPLTPFFPLHVAPVKTLSSAIFMISRAFIWAMSSANATLQFILTVLFISDRNSCFLPDI